jgi:hypothetical protein
MYNNQSDIDVTFLKWKSLIDVLQCCMPLRQTICRTANTPPKTHSVINPLGVQYTVLFRSVLAVKQRVCHRGMHHTCTTMGLLHLEKGHQCQTGCRTSKMPTLNALCNRPFRNGLHSAFLVASLMYDNPSDIDAFFHSEKVPLSCTNVACFCDKPFVVQQRHHQKRTV